MTWLAENRPAESAGATLIHNDFKFDNLVLDPERPDPDRRRPRLGDGHDRRPAHGPGHDAGLLDRGQRSRAAAPVHRRADDPARQP